MAVENLRHALPDLSEAERRRVARRSFQHLGVLFIEICSLLAGPLGDVLGDLRLEGHEHLDEVMRKHGRALLLTAHLGNWELLPAASRLTPYPLTIVVRPLDAPWLNRVAEALRGKADVELIAKQAALRPILTALSRGRLVGILLDQNAARREGVFVPFFGRPASTSRAMAVLALRTGTPVVPIFTHRQPDGRHVVVVQPPIEPEAGKGGAWAITDLTTRYTAAIEAAIRATPDQWLWMHDRWRTRPRPPA